MSLDEQIKNALEYKPMSGQCFQNALMLMIQMKIVESRELNVVHAIVDGQGPIAGTTIVHAWAEDDTFCYDYDFMRDATIGVPKEKYYELSNARNVVVYQPSEAVAEIVACDHNGPWDDTLVEHWAKESPKNRWIVEQETA